MPVFGCRGWCLAALGASRLAARLASRLAVRLAALGFIAALWSLPALAQPHAETIFGQHNDPNQCVNIVIVADGFQAAHAGDYQKACDELAQNLTMFEPYDKMAQFLRVTRVDTFSNEQGCTRDWCAPPAGQPNPSGSKYVVKDTYFHTLYHARDPNNQPACPPVPPGALGWAKPDMTNGGLGTLKAVSGTMPHDLVIIITPDDDLAIAWTFNERDTAPTQIAQLGLMFASTYDIYKNGGGFCAVIAHEMGHAIFHLADEYSDDPSAGCRLPYGPNLDSMVPDNLTIDPQMPKWQHLIDAGLVGPPQQGGWMGCKDTIWHATTECRMLDQTMPHFCPVCLVAMSHGTMARTKLITGSDPPGLIQTADATAHLNFTVNTVAVEAAGKCNPRYMISWEVDGRRREGTVDPNDSGFVYHFSIGGLGALTPGSHKVRFCIGDGQIFCNRPPLARENLGVMPWDSREWWLDIKPPGSCVSLTGDCLPKLSTDESWP